MSMLNIKSYDENVTNLFEKYLKITNLSSDVEMYWKIENVKKDVQFFQEYMDRTEKLSGYRFEPKLSMQGFIYHGFFQKINQYFNYYDFNLLSHHLYIFEILKRIFDNNWISGVGVNNECVKQIIEFHPVVNYYLGINNIAEYVHDFIGSSYGIDQFNIAVKEELDTHK